MKVFVTGASGIIGKAVTKELLSHGHQVLGLIRSDAGADELKSLGAEVQRGTLTDLDMLKKAASQCDGVAHLAFVHNLNDYSGCCAIDRAAIEAMGSALAEAGGNRPFVISSGMMLLTKGQIGTEDQKYDEGDAFGAVRGPSETVALAFAEKGVRVSIMRLPSVYGEGGLGFVALMLAVLQSKGAATYLDAGKNRWPATHTLDVAQAYRLALENGKAGSVYHPVAQEGVYTKDIAEVLGKKLGVPVAKISSREALEILGPMAVAMEADNPSSSAKTREQLGWTPVQPLLLEDLESGACLEGLTALPSWSHRAQSTTT
ncbi:putative oxidoreductase [Xylaria sp. FL1777]|nr:putative oxidoreductase [Xylaria sp. FL1777]